MEVDTSEDLAKPRRIEDLKFEASAAQEPPNPKLICFFLTHL
jgi:hypothetical protein